MRLSQSFVATLLVLALGLCSSVRADQYWDSNGAGDGGSDSDTSTGTWGSDAFWGSEIGDAVTGPWIADETAVFSAGTDVTGTYTVTVSGTQSATGMRFEEGTVTLASGTVNLTNAATVTLGNGRTATINSAISGAAGLKQGGNGTLILGGANTYSGNTRLLTNTAAGTFNILQLGAPGVIPDTSIVEIEGQNSIFDLNGKTETVKSIASINTGAGALTGSYIEVGAGHLILDDETGELSTYQAPLRSGTTGKITKMGGGQINLTATSQFWDGEFVLSEGLLGLGPNNSLGQASSGTAKLTLNGGTFTFATTGSKSLQTQNIDITNSFSALIGAGNIELLGSTGAEGTAIVTLKVDNPTITVSNSTGSGTFIFRGPVVDEGQNRSITKAGAGVLTFNNPGNTYGGDTTILGGQLRIDDNATLGDGTGTVHLSGGSLVTTLNRVPGVNPVPNAINVTADSAILTTRQLDDTVEVDFTSNSIGGSGGTLTFRNDATGTVNPDNQFEPRFSGVGFTFSRPIVIAVTNPLRTTRLNSANASGSQTFSGDISGPGKFRRMVSGGTTVLSGANTYSGGTDVEGGTLSVSGSLATLGTGNVNVSAGTLSIAGGVANAIADTATLSISGTGIVSLGTGIDDLIAGLSLGGSAQASGTYGSSASSAQFQFDQWFSGMGIVRIAAAGLSGDFNEDGKVDAADYVTWRMNETANNPLPNDDGAGTQLARYDLWTAHFGEMAGAGGGSGGAGAVPEPTSLALLMLAGGLALTGGFRRPRRLG